MKRELRIYQLARKINLEASVHCDRMEKNAETCRDCKGKIKYLADQIIKIAQSIPRRKIMPKWMKSWTIDFNVLAGAALTIMNQFGVTVPSEYVVPVLTVANVLLRLKTNKPISAK